MIFHWRQLRPTPKRLSFIEQRAPMGRGIGYLDVHLLASVALAGRVALDAGQTPSRGSRQSEVDV